MKPFTVVLVLVASFLVVPTASATVPGPNGKIAYTVGRQIWLTNPDGTDQHALTGSPCAENVAWSPDTRKIAFNGCGSPVSIYVIDADGRHLKALTSSGCGDFQPTWSPNGSRIAFRRTPGPGGITLTCNNELWTMKANGRDQQQLTHDGVNANDQDPSWSPDGSNITFSRFNPTLQIWVLNLATRVETDIDRTGGAFQDTDPDWSPDATRITYTRCCALGNEVAVMDADGSNQTVLTSDAGNGDFESKWSPDGTKLAFIRAVAAQGIYTMSSSENNVASLGTGPVDFRSISWQSCRRKCP